ncbi:MAG: TrmH family RNA methyltransferase [Flavobacteriaceae bacterium]
MKFISSSKNHEIKQLRALIEKSRVRKRESKFVVEGLREIKKALKGGYSLDFFFVEEGSEKILDSLDIHPSENSIFKVQKSTFEQITVRSGSEKIIAVGNSKSHTLEELSLAENAIVLVIEAPEKPGNIGALYRTATAANIDAVLIANPKTDFYNPNSIRSSLGTVFMMPTALASSQDVISFLQHHSFAIHTAVLHPEAARYDHLSFTPPCAIVMGTESTGLTSAWNEASHQYVMIPMSERVDSLNLSVSAGILMYEVQRKNNLLD